MEILLRREDGLAVEDVAHQAYALGVVGGGIIQLVSPSYHKVPHRLTDVWQEGGWRHPACGEVVKDDRGASDPISKKPARGTSL